MLQDDSVRCMPPTNQTVESVGSEETKSPKEVLGRKVSTDISSMLWSVSQGLDHAHSSAQDTLISDGLLRSLARKRDGLAVNLEFPIQWFFFDFPVVFTAESEMGNWERLNLASAVLTESSIELARTSHRRISQTGQTARVKTLCLTSMAGPGWIRVVWTLCFLFSDSLLFAAPSAHHWPLLAAQRAAVLQSEHCGSNLRLTLALRGGHAQTSKMADTAEERDEGDAVRTEGVPPEKPGGFQIYEPMADDDNNTVPSPFSFNALDAVSIRLGAEGEPFSPLFAHQFFGEKEEIIGYDEPSLNVTYSADDLLPTIEFNHRGIILPEEEQRAGKEPTDVIAQVRKIAPADYVDPTLWRQAEQEGKVFRPPGRLVDDYNFYSMVLSSGKRDRIRPLMLPAGHLDDQVRYEIYHCDAGRDAPENVRQLLRRVESLALWLIERASYVDLDDPNWSCLLLYEKRAAPQLARSEAAPEYRLLGFAMLYRLGLNASKEQLQELTPLYREVTAEGCVTRLRVGQFVVLPPFARRGHGTQLLRTVYRLARRDAQVLDVLVEDQNDDFAAMRRTCELDLLREAGLLDQIRSRDPPWGDLHRASKIAMVQMFLLAEELGSEAGLGGVRPPIVGQCFPTVAGVEVDLERVYSQAQVCHPPRLLHAHATGPHSKRRTSEGGCLLWGFGILQQAHLSATKALPMQTYFDPSSS